MEIKDIDTVGNHVTSTKQIDIDSNKVNAINAIVDSSIRSFIDGFEWRYSSEVDKPTGVINMKKNNCFIAELGEEFMFYSAFVRSFDSSFGNVLENMGNNIAKLNFDVRKNIDSYLLPQQSQHMDYLMAEYENHTTPTIDDYNHFSCVLPKNIQSYKKSHVTDNYFYDAKLKKHYLIELKAGGDLDTKKAKAEKISLLQQYFLLKNSLIGTDETVQIYFATAYNKFGEGNDWKQERVKQFFANEELLIGKDYWNFCCNSEYGFEIVFKQYQESAHRLKEAFERIKKLYF